MEIKSKILKTEPVEWKKLKALQGENFKELTKEAYEKLKSSIKNNQFIESFKVYQDGKTLWVLDGMHRIKALSELEKEGYYIPDKLSADFINCKDKKEASKFVLIYSSIYAKISEEGLYEFLNKNFLDLSDISTEIDLPALNLDEFKAGWIEDLEIPEDFVSTIKGNSEYFSMTFVFEKKHKDKFEKYLKKNSKQELTERIISFVKGR